MIRSIRLSCWRSHADTSLEFRPGTNLLVGMMGAGKSSVLEAVSFALFGTFPALERRKLRLDNIIRLSEPAAKVALELSWDGREYCIERSIERSKRSTSTEAKAYCQGALVEQGQAPVTAYVQGVLGIDYDLFTRAIYSEQNNIDHFLTLDPRRRKEEMDALLGLDRFESARSSIVSVINRVRSNRATLEERYDRSRLAALESREAQLAKDAAAHSELLQKCAAESEKQAKKAAELQAAFEAMKKSRERHEGLSREAIRLGAEAKSLAKALEGKTIDESALKEIESKRAALAEERAALSGEIRALETRLSAASKEAGSLEARLRAAEESKSQLAKAEAAISGLLEGGSMEALQQRLRESEASRLSLESERRSLEREAGEIEASAGKLAGGLSQCPLCLAPLTEDGILHVREEKARMVRERKERASAIAARAAAAAKDAESLSGRLRRMLALSEQAQSLKKAAEASPVLEGQRKALAAEIAPLSAGLESKRRLLEPLAASLEKLRIGAEEMRALISKKAEAARVAASLKETEGALKALAFDEKAFEAARESAERMRLESERMGGERKAAESQLAMASGMLKLVREELESLRSTEKAIAGLASLEEQLAIFKNALIETQASLRMDLTEAINAAMNEIWPVFYPYRNYRALRLLAGERDYSFEVDDGGGWRGLETVASGGERASAALTLRVALAMVLTPKLGWLILDEPTHNLDAEAVSLLSASLQFRVPEVVKQTFIITHDEAFMGSEFASSYRFVRDKENNGETRVESA